MYCEKCGTMNEGSAAYCKKCGNPLKLPQAGAGQAVPPPPNMPQAQLAGQQNV